MKRISDFDNIPVNNINVSTNPEVYIDFSDDPNDSDAKYGTIKIDLKKNETLIKEREDIASKNPKILYKNIFILFIDALSRLNFMRYFPKTMKFLEDL